MINVNLSKSSFILGFSSDKSKNFISDNLSLSPLPATHYTNEDAIIDALKNKTVYEFNNLLKNDSDSYHGWTYVADYKTHPFSHQKGATYYIHARVNKDNQLEFGIFEEIINSVAFKTEKILSFGKAHNNSELLLKIASKEEAEKFILSADKQRIKLSALPKYAGYLNEYSEQYINKHALSVFGNIWTYWYTISNNTLYFCGFPLLLDTSEKGMIYDENGEIVEADLPPTTLNYENADDSNPFKIAVDLVYPESKFSGAKYILEKYCDSSESTSISKTVIGKIENRSVTNFVYNDLISTVDSYSEIGGVYANNDKLEITGPDDLSITQTEDEYYTGNSGFYPFESSYIDIISDDQCYYFENALKTNGFYITNINDNIQINIGNGTVYLGKGKLITEGGGSGFSNWFGGGGGEEGGGGEGEVEGEESKKTKRAKKTYTIDCGDIGYHYYPDEIQYPQIFSHAVYEVDGMEYEGAAAKNKFNYIVDAEKLRNVISGNTRVYSDATYNILTKKLSRKFETWISMYEDGYTPIESQIHTNYTFDNFIKKPNIEDCRYITPENMITQAGGSRSGQAFMNLNVVADDDMLLKSIATSYNGETELDTWGMGEIEKGHFIFENNKLTVWNDVNSETNFRGLNGGVEKTIEIVDNQKIKSEIKNKDIKIENNIFKRNLVDPSSPVSINSFYADSNKIVNHNGEKIRIKYKIRRVKLTPNTKLLAELLNVCASGYNTTPNLSFNPGIYCGDYDLYNGELKTENEYVHTRERVTGDENWGNSIVLDEIPESEVAPLILNFKDLEIKYIPTPRANTQNHQVDDAEEVCAYQMPTKNILMWSGEPQMKLKYKLTHNINPSYNSEDDEIEETELINESILKVKIIPLGSGWYETGQQRDENNELSDAYIDNDLQAHRFTAKIPQKYLKEGEANNIAKIKFFSNTENIPPVEIIGEILSNEN